MTENTYLERLNQIVWRLAAILRKPNQLSLRNVILTNALSADVLFCRCPEMGGQPPGIDSDAAGRFEYKFL